MKTILLIAIFCLPASLIFSQSPLHDKLAGVERVEEIMEIVDAHYAQIERGEIQKTNEGNYKHWARWGLYMSARTDEKGRLVNVDQRVKRAYDTYPKNQRSSEGNWIPRGPNSISGAFGSGVGIGRVDRVAFHPTNANIIYIGTPSGGLFKSTNGGSSWTPLTDNIPSVSVSGIVVSHTDPDVIYILTGDGDSSFGGLVMNSGCWRSSAGVFVSYDGGANWRETAPLPITVTYAGYNLAQDPLNEDVLLAATTEGVYRTANGGGSWIQVLDGRTFEVKFKPGSSTIAYATQDGEFHRSLDGGITWTEVTNFGNNPLPSGRVALAVTADAPSYVFIMSGNAPPTEVSNCGDDMNNTFGGVYLSTNNGASFTRQCNSPNLVESCCDGNNSRSQANYDLALAVSHGDYDTLMAGGILVWKSSSTGVNWTFTSQDVCGGSQSTGYVHADIHDIEYNPLNGHVYVCSDGGIVKSTNFGADWINLSDGVAASQIYHMAGSLTDIDNIMIGLQDNGVKRRNANTSVWDHVVGGDGFDCVYNWNSATTGFTTSNSTVYKFTSNGADVENVTPVAKFFSRVTSGVDDPGLVLVGCDDIHKSTDGGDSWTNKGAAGYWDVERCPSSQFRFYAAGGNSAFATTGSMYFSSDQGDSWDVISGNPGYPSVNIRLTDIDVKPNNSGYVWITFGGFSEGNKVFFSQNAGGSWVNKSGSLPNIPVNAIQVDANNNVYIGTDIGVFYRGADMPDWVPFWNKLPVVPVTDLELYEANNIIRASTFGRGVWESDTYSTCSQSLALTGTLSGNRYFEASTSINCTSFISGGENTRIVLKANGQITLGIGFEARKGNNVHAYIAPCGVAQIGD